MSEENSQYRIDKQLVRRAFDKAADTYDAVAALQNEIGDRLLERLDYIRLQPRRILDLGAGTGLFSAALLKRYRKADVIALDIAGRMLQRAQARGGWFRKPQCVCADAETLPFADDSVDFIFSNLMLQWCTDLEFYKSLRYEIDREEPEVKTLMDFSDSEGILKAAEKCNGSGDCRKTHHMKGGMCPSYHATKNEKDTTRGRANALREFLTTDTGANKFN
ncbi:MAG: methyltransferase domain-containing protein, partial [Gammaproteobacteria bacterium]|nr:methyltransferase domain-containing protein [Gammaproteobacteria bacterium]